MGGGVIIGCVIGVIIGVDIGIILDCIGICIGTCGTCTCIDIAIFFSVASSLSCNSSTVSPASSSFVNKSQISED